MENDAYQIERTVSVIKSPHERVETLITQKNRIYRRRNKDNPNLFHLAKQYCDYVFKSESEIDKGLLVSVLHNRDDGRVAFRNLNEYLEQNDYLVSCFSSETIDITDIFSTRAIIKAGKHKKLIHGNSVLNIFKYIMQFFIVSDAFLATWKVFDQFNILSMDQPHLLLLCSLITLVFIATYFVIRHKSAYEEIIQLKQELAKMDAGELERFWQSVGIGSSNCRSQVYLLRDFHRLDKVIRTCVFHYLQRVQDVRQIWFIFESSLSSSFSCLSYNGIQTAQIEIDMLELSERKELRERLQKTSIITLSQLRYHGVDILFLDSTEIDNEEEPRVSLRASIELFSSKSPHRLTCLYLLSSLTSTYDIYLSKSEMARIIMDHDAPCATKLNMEVTHTVLKQENISFEFARQMVDRMFKILGNYILDCGNNSSEGLRYKFNGEIKSAIDNDNVYTSMLPDFSEVQMWVFVKLLGYGEKLDINGLLLICARMIREIEFERNDPKTDNRCLFTIELLSLLERNYNYYYHEDIFHDLLEYFESFEQIATEFLHNPIIKQAAFHNFIFSPGAISWSQYFKYASMCRSMYKSRRPSNTSVYSWAQIISLDEFKEVDVVDVLSSTRDHKVMKFLELLYNIFSMANTLPKEISPSKYYLGFSQQRQTYQFRGSNLSCLISLVAFIKGELVINETKMGDIPLFFNVLTKVLNKITQNGSIDLFITSQSAVHNDKLSEIYEQIYLLNVISENCSLPLIRLLSNCLLSNINDKYLVKIDQNDTYELIMNSVYYLDNHYDNVDIIYFLEFLMNKNFNMTIKCKILCNIAIHRNPYMEKLNNYIKRHLATVKDIVANTIRAEWFKEDDIDEFFILVVLMDLDQLLEVFITEVTDKFGASSKKIRDYYEIIVKGNVALKGDIPQVITELNQLNCNIAYLLFDKYCEANSEVLLYVPNIIHQLENCILTGVSATIAQFLLHKKVSTQRVGVIGILNKYLYEISAETERCNMLKIKVIDKYKNFIDDNQSIRAEALAKLANFYVLRQRATIRTLEFPLMTITYNLILCQWLATENVPCEEVNKQIRPQTGQMTDVEIKKEQEYIINNYIDIGVVADRRRGVFNISFYAVQQIIIEGKFDFHKRLYNAYDCNQLNSINRRNTIDLLDMLISLYSMKSGEADLMIRENFRIAKGIISMM